MAATSFKEEIKSDQFENEQQMLVLDIFYTADWLEHKLMKILNKYKLTHAQFNMMMLLRMSHGKPMSVYEIRERILFRNSDVSRMVDRLVGKGYLLREVCSVNRRKMDVSISQSGIKILKMITPEIRKEFEHFFEDKITKSEALTASGIIDKMRG